MEARALKRYIGTSPRKMRLVVDLIRNKRVDEAVNILMFTNKNSAKVVEMTVRSAYSNLVNKLDSGRLSQADVVIKEAYVNEGPSMKRILPAPQGRAFRIQKRSAHLTVVVEQVEENLN
ncbi:MAG: 50S ribosomal protein L22 [Ignavibacteria bacterium]|nr:50S ribosomal protein L22 [Ignavibacteria bacterium]MBK9331850.1 50S ribosomal protein L22 [Ignavibacteria bacterium]